MKKQRKVLITGTHHTPAIELINLLRQDKKTDWKISYLGHVYKTESHIAHTIIPKLNVEFYNIDCGKFNRNDLAATILGLPKTLAAIIYSLRLISRLKPDIVMSFGGYVSVPVVIAAYLKGIPSITHEQTPTISLSTKINSYFATKIALSFENHSQLQQLPAGKAYVTGNLIRQAIFNQNSPGFKNSKLNLQKYPLIYITGGNQGSQFINNIAYKLVPTLIDSYTIIHQTGKNNSKSIENRLKNKYPRYHSYEFIENDDIGWILNQARVVVSRSGANICQELALLKKSSILIPLPNTQQNEQQLNADWLQSVLPGRTIVLDQSQTSTQKLLSALGSLPKTMLPPPHPLHQNSHKLLKLINETVG